MFTCRNDEGVHCHRKVVHPWSNMKSSSHKTWQTSLLYLKTSPNTKPKEKKVGGTWHIMSPSSEKLGGHVPRVPHQIAPMATLSFDSGVMCSFLTCWKRGRSKTCTYLFHCSKVCAYVALNCKKETLRQGRVCLIHDLSNWLNFCSNVWTFKCFAFAFRFYYRSSVSMEFYMLTLNPQSLRGFAIITMLSHRLRCTRFGELWKFLVRASKIQVWRRRRLRRRSRRKRLPSGGKPE